VDFSLLVVLKHGLVLKQEIGELELFVGFLGPLHGFDGFAQDSNSTNMLVCFRSRKLPTYIQAVLFDLGVIA
jgi:hypothetical protein